MEPHCDKCIHRTVCKVVDRILPLANSMPMGINEHYEMYDKLKALIADECPEWKRR